MTRRFSLLHGRTSFDDRETDSLELDILYTIILPIAREAKLRSISMSNPSDKRRASCFFKTRCPSDRVNS
ncbi:hypothetical protein CKA32_002736 [Geitlerinema sp. FC II]|nr:hypothetical protein CKA32_002736 [Geitlerinema sp. FC II]